MHNLRNLLTVIVASGLLWGCAAELDLPRCGDGYIDDGEECDDGADNSDNTSDACRRTCVLPWCGDGVLDDQEVCDDGNTASGDGCSDACQVEESFCGDGQQDPGEECDHGESNSDEVANACRLDCSLPSCGDGVIDNDEICDDPAGNSDTEPDACRIGCTLPFCGDEVADTNEDCDASDLGGATCESLGSTGGTLACNTDTCTHDTSGCEECGNDICEPGEDATSCISDCAIIGAACTEPADCGTLPDLDMDCIEVAPIFSGGYCTSPCSPTDPDPCIAGGGACVELVGSYICLRPCTVDGDCRTAEGYSCMPQGAGSYCLDM